MSENTAKTTTEIKKKIEKTTQKNKFTKSENDAMAKLQNEVNEYNKNPDIGIDYEKLLGYIHNHKWAIKPNAHVSSIRDPIRDYYIELLEQPEKIKTKLDAYKIQAKMDELAKNILVKGFVNFDYNKEADDVELGPVALRYLAQELASFLVVRGGKVAATHSKMLQKLAMLELLKD